MFDNKSDYALNKKDKTEIIYQDAYGNTYRISASDLGSIKEFRKWKNWIMMKNHTDEKKDHVHRNHSVSLNELHECLPVVPAIDTDLEHQEMQHEHMTQLQAMIGDIRTILSDTQFRRIWLHYAEGITTREIARIEGATHQAVCKSIKQARKNILKYHQKWVAKKP